MPPSSEPTAPALQNGLVILEMLAASDHPIGFNRIAERLTVSRASTVRLLRVLQRADYVVKDEETGRYRTGPRFAALVPRTATRDALRRESSAILAELVEAVQNTALVIFWNGKQMICINKVIHQASVPMMEVGTRAEDLDAYPWGWVFYDSLSSTERDEAVGGLRDPKAFAQRFPQWIGYYHENGFAYDNHQVIPHLRRLAAPVYDSRGSLVACVGIGGNPHSLPDHQVSAAGALLLQQAHRLSISIGFQSSK